MNISLSNEITVIIGPPDSGKSNLAKWLLRQRQYRSHLVYDPLFGFDPEKTHVIRPPTRETKFRRYEHGNPELNQAVDEYVLGPPKDKRPDYFVVDEAGRLLPNNQPEGSAMGELNDFNAHYGIGVWLIGQRLAQINSDFENKATNYFVMGYQGKNDRDALRNVHKDLPETLDTTQKHGFCYVGSNNTLHKFGPVDEVGAKGGL
jgi:hypothetical protein